MVSPSVLHYRNKVPIVTMLFQMEIHYSQIEALPGENAEGPRQLFPSTQH